jgi:penicillin-binding protein 2
MIELRNVEVELDRFRGRLIAAAVFVLFGFLLLGARVLWLQVWKHDELSTQAEANRIAVVPVVPNRGLILDRNGVVLATNYSAYTLEITPSRLPTSTDAVIDELAQVVDIQTRDRRRYKRLLDESKSFESLPIRTKLTDEEVARFMAQRYRFPGVDVRARLFRHYPLGETGAHLIGYIGRINQAEKKQIEDWDEERQANYKGTEYIGKLGLEQAYEDQLHGVTGFEEVETSAGGRAVRRLNSHGGALVAIDPRSGEVLALVSKPSFDPNLFVDGIDVENWRDLNESIDKPLLNRALRGTYPPGSTFKPFMAMAALNSGKRGPNTVIHDGGTFQFGNHVFRSHGDKGLGPVDMARSIVKSSNVYYYSLANELGVDLMYEQLLPLGFGRKTGIDIEGEVTGLLPSTEWKRRAYRKPEMQRWYAGETISLGIGQGYNNFTALQMAYATATLVSGGQRFKPRLVSDIEDIVTRERKRVASDAVEPLPYKREHVELITKAMHGVTQEGTSVRSFLGAPYKTGGKTGTAQAVSIKQNEKYNAAKLEEHQRDHSWYIAFAPIEAPTVALAVIVENSGFGSEAAAPMARRVFDYLLLGLVPSAEDMALTQQGKSGPIVGKQRPAADYVLPGSPAAAAAAAAAAMAAHTAAAPAPAELRVAERVR